MDHLLTLDDVRDDADVDLLDFDTRDEMDHVAADRSREVMFGLPARPGTRR